MSTTETISTEARIARLEQLATRAADRGAVENLYFGEDGKPRFMPAPDEPATWLSRRYRPDESQTLDPRPPAPYRTFDKTF